MNIVRLDSKDKHITLDDTPATAILLENPKTKPRLPKWHYHSAVGCMSYIQSIIRPDITSAVQQCARFCTPSNREHEEAVKRICCYLLKTKEKYLTLRPNK